MGNESLRSAFGIGRLGDLDACRLRARATAANRRCPISNRRHVCASRAPVRNVDYPRPENLRSEVVWPDPQVALRWQLAPMARDLPPAEYDHPFDGEVVVFDELDEKALQRECGRAINLRPGATAIACAPMGGPGKKCVVHIGEQRLLALQASSFENILRHEIGHCNGWPGDHRGARTWREAERDKKAPTR